MVGMIPLYWGNTFVAGVCQGDMQTFCRYLRVGCQIMVSSKVIGHWKYCLCWFTFQLVTPVCLMEGEQSRGLGSEPVLRE